MLLMQGDCLENMSNIPDKSVDMVLCDLPYGITKCKWDSVIPFERLWTNWKRVCKQNAAIVLTASQPFTTDLIVSNRKWFKYNWVWNKVGRTTGFLNANKAPLRTTEDICVFYQNQCTYNPQKTHGKPYTAHTGTGIIQVYNKKDVIRITKNEDGLRYPKNLISFNVNREKHGHPTQKPVELISYLIRTYTNEGETVLDNCMGSGTTGVSCVYEKRNFIGIELEEKYFEIAKKRIEDASCLLSGQ